MHEELFDKRTVKCKSMWKSESLDTKTH